MHGTFPPRTAATRGKRTSCTQRYARHQNVEAHVIARRPAGCGLRSFHSGPTLGASAASLATRRCVVFVFWSHFPFSSPSDTSIHEKRKGTQGTRGAAHPPKANRRLPSPRSRVMLETLLYLKTFISHATCTSSPRYEQAPPASQRCCVGSSEAPTFQATRRRRRVFSEI